MLTPTPGRLQAAGVLSRDQFGRNLADATRTAIEIARTWVLDELPDAARYDLWLVLGDERDVPRFDPELASLVGARPAGLTGEQVIAALWHEGRAPEWIDISVVDVAEGCTYLELRLSRHLSSERRPLWYVQDGVPPFHTCGPYMPRDRSDERFFLRQSDHDSPGIRERHRIVINQRGSS
jgi:hypothetical protein